MPIRSVQSECLQAHQHKSLILCLYLSTPCMSSSCRILMSVTLHITQLMLVVKLTVIQNEVSGGLAQMVKQQEV